LSEGRCIDSLEHVWKRVVLWLVWARGVPLGCAAYVHEERAVRGADILKTLG
jgi:hypothetical protein